MKKKGHLYQIQTKSSAWSFILFFIFTLTIFSETNASSEDKVLFESNFSDLRTNWEIWDDPSARDKPSQWRVGLAELSGIRNREQKMATALLAGETSWQNYSVETSCYMKSERGYLVGIVFGFQDSEHCYIAGYNFDERRFELVAKTSEGFENLAVHKIDFPANQEIPLRLEFTASRIRFHANNHIIFDIEDDRYQKGRFGLCSSGLDDARVHLGPVTEISQASFSAIRMRTSITLQDITITAAVLSLELELLKVLKFSPMRRWIIPGIYGCLFKQIFMKTGSFSPLTAGLFLT